MLNSESLKNKPLKYKSDFLAKNLARPLLTFLSYEINPLWIQILESQPQNHSSNRLQLLLFFENSNKLTYGYSKLAVTIVALHACRAIVALYSINLYFCPKVPPYLKGLHKREWKTKLKAKKFQDWKSHWPNCIDLCVATFLLPYGILGFDQWAYVLFLVKNGPNSHKKIK